MSDAHTLLCPGDAEIYRVVVVAVTFHAEIHSHVERVDPSPGSRSDLHSQPGGELRYPGAVLTGRVPGPY